MFCYSHPKEATGVACGRCGRPICNKCMVSGPAGMRCFDCGSFRSAAITQDNPTRLGLGVVAGLVAAIALSYIMAFVVSTVGFLACLAGPAYGWAVGEVVAQAAGRQKPRTLQAIGIGCTLLGLLIVFVLEFGGRHPLPVMLPQVTWTVFGVSILLAVSACVKRLKK